MVFPGCQPNLSPGANRVAVLSDREQYDRKHRQQPISHFVLDIYIHCGYTQHVNSQRTATPAQLPLPEATFHILMAVAEDDRHGYAIIQDVTARTDGKLKLSPGTLYRSIQHVGARPYRRDGGATRAGVG